MVVDLPLCGPMLSPRVPNLVPIPGPRMQRETPGQRPRPNYGHPHPGAITFADTAREAIDDMRSCLFGWAYFSLVSGQELPTLPGGTAAR